MARVKDERSGACLSGNVRKRERECEGASTSRKPTSALGGASTNGNGIRRNPTGTQKQKPKTVAFAPTANGAQVSNSGHRKTQTESQQNYIIEFPSIMHLISEYPHIKQLLDETAADKDNPVEMFSTHFLSAMLIPEGESLQASQFVVVNDQWRQEWERGVQVPVNMHKIPQPQYNVSESREGSAKRATSREPFRLPSKRYLGEELTNTDNETKACPYDADQLDAAWLTAFNSSGKRNSSQLAVDVFEELVEAFENAVNERLRTAIAQQESFFRVQFDQSVACDVCRSPKAADSRGNAMVFCDACNVCVHQLCYGVSQLPAEEDSWLCAPCARGVIAPACALCGYAGGALKPLESLTTDDCSSTQSGLNSAGEWAHISCALWLPEFSIGDADSMEPVVAVEAVSETRRRLRCGLCDRENGLCFACCRAGCTEAFHVTCAMSLNLRFRAVWRAAPDDSVGQVAYCRKHSLPPVGMPSPSKRGAVESVAAPPSPLKSPRRSRSVRADVKRTALSRIYRSVSRSSSENSSRASTPTKESETPRVRVIPQETVTKCHRELQERVAAIREQFDRAARSVLDRRLLDSLAKRFAVPAAFVRSACSYWLLKRRANRGRPLLHPAIAPAAPQSPTGLSPRSPDTLLRPIGTAVPGSSNFVLMGKQNKRTGGLDKLVAHAHTFIGLRRNLERLRNLTYLLIRRERLRRLHVLANCAVVDSQVRHVQKFHSIDLQLASESQVSELQQLLCNAHVGDSFYENEEVFDALTTVYQQFCAQQNETAGNSNRLKRTSESEKSRKRNEEVTPSKVKRKSKPKRPRRLSLAEESREKSSSGDENKKNGSGRVSPSLSLQVEENDADADKENHKAERTVTPSPRKPPVLGEQSSPVASPVPNSRKRVAFRVRGRNCGNGSVNKCSSASSAPKKRNVTQNSARQAALKKLKISLKVNMRDMQLRPRNGLILRVRLPTKSHT